MTTAPRIKHCRAQTLFIPDVPEIRSYLAGLIDGEGSFYYRNGSGDSRRASGWFFAMGMTCQEVIEWCGKFGGRVNERNMDKWRRQPIWEWKVSRRLDLLALIEAVEPYLIVKHEVALEAYTVIMEEAGLL